MGEFVIESVDGARYYTFSKFEKVVTGSDDLGLQSIEGLLPNFLSTGDIDVFEREDGALNKLPVDLVISRSCKVELEGCTRDENISDFEGNRDKACGFSIH